MVTYLHVVSGCKAYFYILKDERGKLDNCVFLSAMVSRKRDIDCTTLTKKRFFIADEMSFCENEGGNRIGDNLELNVSDEEDRNWTKSVPATDNHALNSSSSV